MAGHHVRDLFGVRQPKQIYQPDAPILHEGIDQRAFEQAGVVVRGPGRSGTDAFSFSFWTDLQQKMS